MTGSASCATESSIEMGTLAEMRHLSALTVEATIEGPLPELSGILG